METDAINHVWLSLNCGSADQAVIRCEREKSEPAGLTPVAKSRNPPFTARHFYGGRAGKSPLDEPLPNVHPALRAQET